MSVTYSKPIISIPSNRSFSHNIELLIEFIKRDLKIKHRNLFFGVLWILIQAVVLTYIFVFIREHIVAEFTIYRLDYTSVFLVLIPWLFFTNALQRSIYSITSNSNLIYKTNFSIIILPIAVSFSCLIDMLINIIFFFFLSLFYKGGITPDFIFFPIIMFICSIFIFALSILFAVLQCFITETTHILSFLIKLSIFILPILYNENFIREDLRSLYIHVPLVWAISKTKELMTGKLDLFSQLTLEVLVISILSLFVVYLFYKKTENHIVDYL